MPDMKNMVSRMHLMNPFERLNLTPSACGLSLACLEWQACMHKIYVTTANYCHLIFYLVQACFCIKWTWVSLISPSLVVWLGRPLCKYFSGSPVCAHMCTSKSVHVPSLKQMRQGWPNCLLVCINIRGEAVCKTNSKLCIKWNMDRRHASCWENLPCIAFI